MAFLYIETEQFKHAGAILYNLLNEEDPNLHSLYLSMKLISKVATKSKEISMFSKLGSYFYDSQKETSKEDLYHLRTEVMKCLCSLKPNNHLYKVWSLHWEILHNELTPILKKEECVEKVMLFLKYDILDGDTKTYKYDLIINTIFSIITITGFSLFIKNFIIPILKNYFTIKRENTLYYQPQRLYEKPILPRDKLMLKPIEIKDEPIDNLISKDFEYVDNLYQEIQHLAFKNAQVQTPIKEPLDEIPIDKKQKLSATQTTPTTSQQTPTAVKTFGGGKKQPSDQNNMMRKLSQFK